MTDAPERRLPIDRDELEFAEPWRVEVIDSTASTNADMVQRFAAGESEGLVLVAEEQTAGRGRLDRDWVTPPRASLTASFLLVPEVEPARWPWLPLVAGIATASAVSRATGCVPKLKWPNDVLVGGSKLAGILVERATGPSGVPGAVVGIGINVDQTRDELPVSAATSLALVGVTPTRTDLLTILMEELGVGYQRWVDGADPRADYAALCDTLGREVQIQQPSGELTGVAIGIDPMGRLVVRTPAGEEHVAAGDVVHVRPTGESPMS